MSAGARTRRVAAHYDELSGHYVDLWGEHIHHGYYPRGDETRNEATRNLIELLLRDMGLCPGSAVLDVGCGVGGTSRLLASAHRCRVVGVTLSRTQARMAADASARGRPPRYVVADAAALPLSASFDAVLAVEVLSHVEDRGAFFSEAARLLRPGGRLGIAAWMKTGDLAADHAPQLIESIEESMLVTLPTPVEYEELLADAGLTMVSYRDISEQVARTWDLCLEIVGNPALWSLAVKRGGDTLAFVRSFLSIKKGFACGALRYALITGAHRDRPEWGGQRGAVGGR